MYVDHAFSISDEDIMMGTSYTVNNKPPIKEIALAVSLLVCGLLGIIIGSLMAYNHVGGDTAHAMVEYFQFFCTDSAFHIINILVPVSHSMNLRDP
ncbi:hypothetical protein ACSQ67_020131 [Phaseolus vulgaris]